jgi:hypothetical protein
MKQQKVQFTGRGIFTAEKIDNSREITKEVNFSLAEIREDIEVVPEQLRKYAIQGVVTGAKAGRYFIVPYSGNIKEYTKEVVKAFFIPIQKEGKNDLLHVSVCSRYKIIYIAVEDYQKYIQILSLPNGFELK